MKTLYRIETRNGATRDIETSKPVDVATARRAFIRNPSIRSIDIFRVDETGEARRADIIHGGNTFRVQGNAFRVAAEAAAQAAQGEPGAMPSNWTRYHATAPQAAAQAAPRRFWNVTSKKIGGLRFVRIGRLSMSFCVTRKPV